MSADCFFADNDAHGIQDKLKTASGHSRQRQLQYPPVAGMLTYTRQNNYNYPGTSIVVTTVSKEIDDQYWRVVAVDNDSETIEYFARELKILHDPDNEESAFFTCDFVDF